MSNSIFKGNQVGFRFLGIEAIAEKYDLPLPPLRFMIGILLGFPFAFLYLLVPKHSASAKNILISFAGVFISYFCFGSDCIYIFFSIIVSYVSLIVLGGSLSNVILTFLFQTGYLFASYIIYASDGYDVMWTTPQCIVCLRLIGLAWDCYDGQQDKEKLSSELKDTCYSGTPTFLEVFGYSLFFGAFMAGPQFSFNRYKKFLENTLVDEDGRKANNTRFTRAIERLLLGVCAVSMFIKFDPLFQASFLLEPKFLMKSFLDKVVLMTITFHVHFLKYMAIWSFCESVCIIVGLSYNGTKDGYAQWDGVNNVKFLGFLCGPFCQDLLESFNVNTSQWASRYLFKRLRFLGNKYLSQVLTLVFLSLWHGFYVGYAILFTYEFLMLVGERMLSGNLRVITDISYKNLSIGGKILVGLPCYLYRLTGVAYASIAFMLLRWRRIKIVYGAVYHWLSIFLLVLYVVIIPVTSIIAARKKRSTTKKAD